MATSSSIDLNSLVSSTLDQVKGMGDSISAVADIRTQQSDLAQQQVRDANDAKIAAETISDIKSNDAMRQENLRISIANRMGTNAADVGWKIGQLADEVTRQTDRALAASERIRQKDSVNFLDSPLQYIINQLTINSDIAELNAAEEARNVATGAAKDLEAITQASFQTNAALTQTANEASIQASKILAGHQYAMEANKAAAEGLRWNLEGIQMASAMGKDQLNLLYEANRAQMQQKQYDVELQRLQLAKNSFELQKRAADEKLNEDGLINKYISKGYFNLTGQVMDPVKAKEAITLFRANAPQFKQYFESGMQSYMLSPDGKTSVISLSPYDASEAYANRMVTNVPKAQEQVLDKLVELRREFNNPAVQAQLNIDKKDKKSIEGAFNTWAAERIKAEQGNIVPGSIFAPVSPDKVAAADPKVAALPIWKTVLEPAKNAGVDLNDPNVVSGLVLGAMTNGKLSYADALDMQFIWAKGMQMNKMERNFLAMGVSAPTGYNTKIDIPLTFGKTTVNVTDPLSWATAVNKMAANNAIKNQGIINAANLNPIFAARNIGLQDTEFASKGNILDNTTPRKSPYISGTTTAGQKLDE